MSRIQSFDLIILIAITAPLRLFQLGDWSFWHDEALTVLLAQKPLAHLIAITASDVHPPLYFLLVKAMLSFGQSEAIVRLISVIGSTGAVGLVYLIGRDCFNQRTGLISGLIMAIAPLQIFYAQEARMYGLLILLTSLLSLAFLRAINTGQRRWWTLFVLTGTLASYTAYFIFPIFAAMGLYLLLFRRDWRQIQYFSLSLVAIGLLYLPWLSTFLAQTQAVSGSYWLTTPSILTIFTTLSGFLIGTALSETWVIIGLGLSLMVTFILLNTIRHQLQRGSADKQALLWLLCWLLIPIISTYLISLIRPIYQIRTVLTASPPLYLLLGWWLTRVPQRRLHQILFLPVILVMLVSLYNFYFDDRYAKPAWREAAAYVHDQAQLADVAIHTSTGSFLPFLTYPHAIEHRLLPEETQSAAENAPSQAIVEAVSGARLPAAEATRGYKHIWLIVALDHAIDYQLSQKAYFDAQFALIEAEDLGGIMIYHYQTRQ